MGFLHEGNLPAILQTKIEPASLPVDIVCRPRLIKRLDELTELPVTLVVGPAGYGKSCLASLWMRRTKRACAWVSLHNEDRNYGRFWSYIIAALIDAGLDAEDLLSRSFSLADDASVFSFADRITKRIIDHRERLTLILDDYHLIDKESPVHASLSYLVAHVPNNIRILIISRTFPRIGLQKLRVQGLLGIVDESDLAFTLIETEDLFFRSRQPLTPVEARFIQEYTKGWPVAVKLTSLAYAKDQEVGQVAPSFEVGKMIHDYLFEEVLDKLPENIRTFLAVTACVDGFSESLARCLTGNGSPEIGESLGYLKENSLFITETVKPNGELWYRYHNLFQEAVLHHSRSKGQEFMSAARKKASIWYEKRGFLDEAVKIAAQVQDFGRIQDLIYRNWNSFYQADRLINLMGWYGYLPEEYITRRPMLCAIEALPLAISGKADLALRRLQAAGDAMKERHDDYYGLVMAIQGIAFSVLGMCEEALVAAEEALKYLPPEEEYLHGMSYQILGGVKVFTAPEEAAQDFEKVLKMSLTHKSDNLLCSARANLSVIYSILGQLSTALQWADVTLAAYEASTHVLRPMLVFAYESRAFSQYKQGQLAEAKRNVNYAIEHAYECWNPTNTARAYAVRAHIAYFACEDEAAASDVRQSMQISPSGFAREYPALPILLFWMGKDLINRNAFDSLCKEQDQEAVVWIKTALRFLNGETVDLEDFGLFLDGIPEERMLAQIQFRILLAAMQETRGDRRDAEQSLGEAISLSRKIGTSEQAFIENASYIAKPLGRIAKRDSDSYLAHLYRLLPASKPSTRTRDAAASSLTVREKEVIKLLAAGLTTKETAERLFVSTATVKKHLSNIYTKLGVHGRVQAIVRLKEEGLLTA